VNDFLSFFVGIVCVSVCARPVAGEITTCFVSTCTIPAVLAAMIVDLTVVLLPPVRFRWFSG